MTGIRKRMLPELHCVEVHATSIPQRSSGGAKLKIIYVCGSY
jgi:hypothetical protein